jgi:hypothetical protein
MDKDKRSTSFLERRTPVAVAAAAAAAAVGALLVNRYVPLALDRFDDPAALTVVANYNRGLYESCGWTARLPATADSASEPPTTNPADIFAWVLASGGAPVSPAEVRINLEGRRDGGVEVVGLTANPRERSEDLSGPEISVPCEGVVEAVEIGFDLDEPGSPARTITDPSSAPPDLGEPYFFKANVNLQKNESLPMAAQAQTSSGLIEWDLTVVALERGRETSYRHRGPTLRTTAGAVAPSARWLLTQDPSGQLVWLTIDQMCSLYPWWCGNGE